MKKNKLSKMNKKGSILMIVSWVLSLLVIFAVSIGFRSSIAAKVSRYQKERLKGGFLLKAGISRMIYELGKDNNDYDTVSESWADNEKIFNNISFGGDKKEFCKISYIADDTKEKFGAQDEESKININDLNTKIIEEIFIFDNLSADAKEFSLMLKEWLSRESETAQEKKIFKNDFFTVKEELLLVLEYFYKDKNKAYGAYDKIKDLITVYGDGKTNINTASKDVLLILARSLAETQEEKAAAETLVDNLIKLKRDNGGYFKDISGISIDAGLNPSEFSLWTKLSGHLCVKSNFFRIDAKSVTLNGNKAVTAIFDRKNKKIAYWHEN